MALAIVHRLAAFIHGCVRFSLHSVLSLLLLSHADSLRLDPCCQSLASSAAIEGACTTSTLIALSQIWHIKGREWSGMCKSTYHCCLLCHLCSLLISSCLVCSVQTNSTDSCEFNMLIQPADVSLLQSNYITSC